jgi:hypothetical protein
LLNLSDIAVSTSEAEDVIEVGGGRGCIKICSNETSVHCNGDEKLRQLLKKVVLKQLTHM